MTIFATLLGAALIVVTLRDIFNSLFHPLGSATVSRLLVVKPLWHVFRRLGGYHYAVLESAGPSMLLTIIGGWIVLLVSGWALIYWPHLSSEFLVASGLTDVCGKS
jgi:hypothetical protein